LNKPVRVTTHKGQVIMDGTQWIDTVINGYAVNKPVHVSPEHTDHVMSQLIALVTEAYYRGYKNGELDTQTAVKNALGILP